MALRYRAIEDADRGLVVRQSVDAGYIGDSDTGTVPANGFLPVVGSRGEFLSREAAYDVGLPGVVPVPGGVDIAGIVFRAHANDIYIPGCVV